MKKPDREIAIEPWSYSLLNLIKLLMSHQSKILQIAASERQQENHDWTCQHDHGNQSQLNECFKVNIVQKTQKLHLSPRLRLALYRNS